MRIHALVAIVFVGACAASACIDYPVPLDISLHGPPDECTPSGGICGGECPFETHHYSSETCPDFPFPGACCKLGRDPSRPPPSPPLDTAPSGPMPPPPYDVGKCNGVACAPGCVCRSKESAGACVATCDCTRDGGASADAAGDPDAADAGDMTDAADDADASGALMMPDGTVKCGVIGCSTRCDCQSQSLSTCVCFSGDCH